MKEPNSAARKITRLVWRQRIVTWGSRTLIAVTLLGAVVAWTWYREGQIDPTLDAHSITATVTGHGAPGRGAMVIHAHTDDGRDVDAFSMLRVAPPVGTHIILSEARHKSGRHSFDVLRLTE